MGQSIGTIGQPANPQQAALQQQLMTPQPNANQAAPYSPQYGGMVQAPGTTNYAWLPPAAQTGPGGQGLVNGPQSNMQSGTAGGTQSSNGGDIYGMQSPGGLVYDPSVGHLVVTPQGMGNQSPANLAIAAAAANAANGGTLSGGAMSNGTTQNSTTQPAPSTNVDVGGGT